MSAVSLRVFLFTALAALLFSCTRETEQLETAPYAPERLAEYFPHAPGKYFIYHLDSLVFTEFGRNEEVHSYQEKHQVDTVITDNLGRPSYRVFRFLRNADGTGPWRSAGVYLITRLRGQVEVVENNMRVIKLILPVKTGTTWKGNRYLSEDPYAPLYSFNNDNHMSLWNFTIDSTGGTLALNGKNYSNVLTINQVNTHNLPDTLNVEPGNVLTIPNTKTDVWARGASTDTITVTAMPPLRPGNDLYIYNGTHHALMLDSVYVPVAKGRLYEYRNGKWQASANAPMPTDDLPVASVDVSIEKYASGIGLVYQEVELWQFETNTAGSSAYKIGFGIKRTLLEHN